ncbi:L,D-transpeptidase [Microvirga sp. GCM10011540]|uniref:L,D-transpeptidase n=1 Tax=Microvirga sp. GCM10011540 TaxID=3317338 RepID=UPI0036066D1D
MRQSVSSGCIRLFNQDIVDLHRWVPVGTSVAVPDGSCRSLNAHPNNTILPQIISCSYMPWI